MDPARLLAARLQERVADVAFRGAMSVPRRHQQWCRRDPSKARMQGRQSEGERKTATRDSLSRRNGTTANHTGRGPAVPRPPLNRRVYATGESACLIISTLQHKVLDA